MSFLSADLSCLIVTYNVVPPKPQFRFTCFLCKRSICPYFFCITYHLTYHKIASWNSISHFKELLEKYTWKTKNNDNSNFLLLLLLNNFTLHFLTKFFGSQHIKYRWPRYAQKNFSMWHKNSTNGWSGDLFITNKIKQRIIYYVKVTLQLKWIHPAFGQKDT